ncbi:NADP-dependent oxidoreductase [Bradyrhizobium quebecense]|nr:NADP-dependent oxidoreductase [Bradyrhizobium quebecense]
MIKDTDFDRRNEAVPDPKDGEFLVRVTHLSFDPTQRPWMSRDTYVPAIPIGGVVRAAGAGQVVKSRNPNFKEGELVQGSFGWQDYIVTNGTTDIMPVTKLPAGVSPEQALGIFGITGLTAYFGLTDVGKPSAGDTVVVSGAAGATGSVVVQLAKALGCTVIGIAGGSEKCRWVVEQAKADAAIDYKRENVAARIKELAPKGVNIVFENVAGEILDASLQNLALRARIVLCGGISGYNADDPNETIGIRNYLLLIGRRARMEGFIILDYAPRFGEAVEALSKLIARGALKTPVDLQEGFENIPSTMRRLFEGKNIGKQLLKIADPPLARN